MEPSDPTYEIDLEPIGRRALVGQNTTILQAAHSAGIEIAAVCGGEGWCGKCRVRLMKGELSPLTLVERQALSEDEIKGGFRLACQAFPAGDVKVDIPPDVLTASQRLQLEGLEQYGFLEDHLSDPVIVPVDIQLEKPSLKDQHSDFTRLKNHLLSLGLLDPAADLAVMDNLSQVLRSQDWKIRLAMHGSRIIAGLKSQEAMLGLAVDIGTTKIAAYLIDVETGETIAKTGSTNPQVAYGEDVVSRIAYANTHTNGRHVLQADLVERLNEMAAGLCRRAGVEVHQIVIAVVVGNTAMHHFFLNLPVHQLGEAPYVPAASEAIEAPARDLGLNFARGAFVYIPPNIAGYVGADHVSMLLATDIMGRQGTIVALDIGTNTEISLYTNCNGNKRLLCCSCASGPAFEGAHIQDGMRAVPGAIERMQIMDGVIHTHTIHDQPPVGICGSGILDVVAELRKEKILDSAGRLKRGAAGVRVTSKGGEFILVPAAQSGHHRDVVVTRKDVNEIQLAKGAIRAGLEVLLQHAALTYKDIDEFIIAGAFGTYLDIDNAVRVGMFPPLPRLCFKQVGNAAGIGAKILLLSETQRKKADFIASQEEYIELTAEPIFKEIYVEALSL